jgi:dihydroorotate dehydrogenase (fumarate)
VSADLTTTYLGLHLTNPVVASASPLTASAEGMKRLADAGASAIVMASLFEEQIEHDQLEVHRMLETGADAFGEALSYFPELDDYRTGPEVYLNEIEKAKAALDVPVIASLNGTSEGGWIGYAKRMEEAGADAIELNVYHVPTDPYATADQVEAGYLKLVSAVKGSISVPLAVKVGPYFSSLANMASEFSRAGADGLVLFNRFQQPDIDLESLRVDPTAWLSSQSDMRLPLRWVGILSSQLDLSLAATGGVHTAEDVLKLILVGADVAMPASALLKSGPAAITQMLDGIQRWLDERDYESVEQAKGSMNQANVADPSAFERGSYMKALTSYSSPTEWS